MFRHVTTRFSGLVILIAGLWGGLIPFLGPVFHFTLGPDKAWTWTTGRLWLSVLPAAAAVLGGLILMGGGPRLSGRFGALLALAGGVWFAIGPDVSMLWNHGISQQGIAHGKHTITRMLEHLTLHSGIGVLITAFAAYSLPGAAAYAVGRRRVARDAAMAETGAGVGAAEARHRDRVAAREGAVGAGAAGAGAGTAAGAGAGGAGGAGTGAAGAGAGTAAAAEPAAGTGAAAPGAAAAEPAAGGGAGGAGAGTTPAAEPAGAGAAAPGGATATEGQTAAQPAAGAATTQRRGGLLSRLFGPR